MLTYADSLIHQLVPKRTARTLNLQRLQRLQRHCLGHSSHSAWSECVGLCVITIDYPGFVTKPLSLERLGRQWRQTRNTKGKKCVKGALNIIE